MPNVHTTPRPINHVAVNVPDLDRAVAWYREVFGFEVLIPAFEIVAGQGEPGQRFAGLAGPSFHSTRIAYLTTANGVGLELFQFTAPPTGPVSDDGTSPLGEFWRPGPWHFSITDPDVDGLIERVVAAGGARVTHTVETPAGSGYRLAFCADPFGNRIEIMAASFEHGLSNLVPASAATQP